MTETEKADKLERDAQESVTEAKESVTDESPTPTGTPPGSSTHVREVRTELSFAQQNLVEKLSEIYSPDKVLAPARLVMLSDELIEEITVSAAVEGILFELRYGPPELVRTSSPTLERLRQVALAAITAKSRAVLIVVVSDYTTPMQIASWTAHVRQIAEAHYSVLGFYVGKYSDFIALSARDFEAKVGLDYTSTSGYRPYVHKSDEDPYKRPR